jgi:hypothetical protein
MSKVTGTKSTWNVAILRQTYGGVSSNLHYSSMEGHDEMLF